MEQTTSEQTVVANIFNLPVGTVMAYGGPWSSVSQLKSQGWLPCVGDAASKREFPDLYKLMGDSCGTATTNDFYLPDLRGQFLRGVSGAEDIDAGQRTAQRDGGNAGPLVFSRQDDGLKAHTHSISVASFRENIHFPRTNDHYHTPTTVENMNTDSAGGKETRPKNVYVHYIIFAGIPQMA